jgi:hypothetical protein
MKVYSYFEARQQLAEVLKRARRTSRSRLAGVQCGAERREDPSPAPRRNFPRGDPF